MMAKKAVAKKTVAKKAVAKKTVTKKSVATKAVAPARKAKAGAPICPRCGDKLRGPFNVSLSRADNITAICSDCGSAEAMAAMTGRRVTKRGWVAPKAARPEADLWG